MKKEKFEKLNHNERMSYICKLMNKAQIRKKALGEHLELVM